MNKVKTSNDFELFTKIYITGHDGECSISETIKDFESHREDFEFNFNNNDIINVFKNLESKKQIQKRTNDIYYVW
jgi:hypothetical protein